MRCLSPGPWRRAGSPGWTLARAGPPAATRAPARSPQLRTDSEKRSLAESGLSWFSESEDKAPRKPEYDSGSLKMEPGASKWRRERPESCDDASKVGDLKKPISLGHPGTLKKGKTPPVAVTSPITHTAQSALRVSGEPAGGWGRAARGLLPAAPPPGGPQATGRERALAAVRGQLCCRPRLCCPRAGMKPQRG